VNIEYVERAWISEPSSPLHYQTGDSMAKSDFREFDKQPTSTASLTLKTVYGGNITTKAGAGFKWCESKSAGARFLEFTDSTDVVRRIFAHTLAEIPAELDVLED
jgi:hypothetical protein